MSDEVSGAFDSEEWMALARSDPEQFEKRRTQAIDEVINSAPAHIQRRLRGLQWRIDLERSRAGTPLGACVRLCTRGECRDGRTLRVCVADNTD